jgi:MFS transporter, UMF1 family
MTGRAASFLAPLAFAFFVDCFHTVRAGLGGLSLVLGAGMVAMLTVRPQTAQPQRVSFGGPDYVRP